MVIQSSTPKAAKFFEEAEGLMIGLWARWQDERKYEDINEYRKPLDPIAESCGVKILKMNKRPFGCDFQVGDRIFQLKITSQNYSYQRTR